MNYYLFKLQFTAAAHFGHSDSALSLYTSNDHFCADTLFSALCHTAGELFGPEGIQTLCSWVQDGRLRLSDSMPWHGDSLYLPKPCITGEAAENLPTRLRKKVKQLRWIALEDFSGFAESLRGNGIFDPDIPAFGLSGEQARSKIEDEALPYRVGIYRFFPDCGLYFLAGCDSTEVAGHLRILTERLGLGGIGGKVSSGCGSFSVCQYLALEQAQTVPLQWLNLALQNNQAGHQLLLTTSLPTDAELDHALEGATYQLLRRGGFASIDGNLTSSPKKQTQHFLAAGAVLRSRYNGELYNVCDAALHPVYRYGVPIFMGVTL